MMTYEKTIRLVVLLVLGVIAGTAAAMYWRLPEKVRSHLSVAEVSTDYTCPMHPEIHSKQSGQCPLCHMALVAVNMDQATEALEEEARHGCCPSPASTAPSRSNEAACPYHPTVKSSGIKTDPPPGCPVHRGSASNTPPASTSSSNLSTSAL